MKKKTIIILVALLITVIAGLLILIFFTNNPFNTDNIGAVEKTLNESESTTETTTTENQTTTENLTTAPNYIVDTKSSNLNIRSDASPTAKSVGEIPKDTKVHISQIKNDWGYLSYNSLNGWVSMQFMRPFSDQVTDADLEAMSKYFVAPLLGCFGGWHGGYLGYDQIDWNNLTPNLVGNIVFSLDCSGYLTQIEPTITGNSNEAITIDEMVIKGETWPGCYGPAIMGGYNLTDINKIIYELYGSKSRPLTSSDFSQFSRNWKFENGCNPNSGISVAYSQDYQTVLVFFVTVTGWEDPNFNYIAGIKTEGDAISLYYRNYTYYDNNEKSFEQYYNTNFSQKESLARQYYFEGLGNEFVTLECEAEYIFSRNTNGGFNLKSVRIIQ